MELRTVERYMKISRLGKGTDAEAQSARNQAEQMLKDHPKLAKAAILADKIERDDYAPDPSMGAPPPPNPPPGGGAAMPSWYENPIFRGAVDLAVDKLGVKAKEVAQQVLSGVAPLTTVADVQALPSPDTEVHLLFRFKRMITRAKLVKAIDRLEAMAQQILSE
jgi:hypothetical protein